MLLCVKNDPAYQRLFTFVAPPYLVAQATQRSTGPLHGICTFLILNVQFFEAKITAKVL